MTTLGEVSSPRSRAASTTHINYRSGGNEHAYSPINEKLDLIFPETWLNILKIAAPTKRKIQLIKNTSKTPYF